MRVVKKLAKLLFLLIAPLLMVLLWAAFSLSDLFSRPKRKRPQARPSSGRAGWVPPSAASIIIPNWNGKDLLEKFLPSVLAGCGPEDEIIVVDNASTDGSADFVEGCFPRVRVLRTARNLGFGGGCNVGAKAAARSIVVMLNNDMRAAPGFLSALLDGFTDPDVFAVSAQIFFSNPARRREETGLTAGWFSKGFVRVRHEADADIQQLYPTFYAGGGSTAYDREKFLELGGFDPLFEPFYLEDTDLSFNAWRRGWKVLYQPASRLFHEHRGTIGKHYSPAAIQAYLQKNYVLMVWKNIHRRRWLVAHFAYLYGHMLMNSLGWRTDTRTTIGAFLLALRKLPEALRCRRRGLLAAQISDRQVFERVRPSVFRDWLLETGAEPGPDLQRSSLAPRGVRPLRILFVSPYSINPPLHGGAVFMLQALRQLAKRHDVFLLTFVDQPEEVEANKSLEDMVRKVEVFVRKHRRTHPFHMTCSAQRTFDDPKFAALLDKMVLLHEIDLIQFEYTQLAQYRLPLRRIPQCLFEHDLYFRSVARQFWTGSSGALRKGREALEWLRGLRYELRAAHQFDAVFTCHEQEAEMLESLLPSTDPPKICSGLRTAVDVSSYDFPGGPRRPHSLLFVGNFQHRPNAEGLETFCQKIFPLVRARNPHAVLYVVGANMPSEWHERFAGDAIRLLGQVPDIREPLSSCAVFVCPIWMGAGVRVKILEAFASGIPVVSTTFGAEGLAAVSGTHLLLADTPQPFADACVRLLENSEEAEAIAANARRLVETEYDWSTAVGKLDAVYRDLVRSRRKSFPVSAEPPLEIPTHAGLIAQ